MLICQRMVAKERKKDKRKGKRKVVTPVVVILS